MLKRAACYAICSPPNGTCSSTKERQKSHDTKSSLQKPGGLAQLVERLLCTEKVSGSTPLASRNQLFMRHASARNKMNGNTESEKLVFIKTRKASKCLKELEMVTKVTKSDTEERQPSKRCVMLSKTKRKRLRSALVADFEG